MFYLPSILVFFAILYPGCLADVVGSDKNCSCGFYDAQTDEFFTDSVIVYFNETESLTPDFAIEEYENVYEKDWNAVYREGADPSNVRINNSDSLQLFVSPTTKHHLVKGGSIRTVRRDIQHGSFRTFIKSPRSTFSGSAMSMILQYNETETTELSVMNGDNTAEAWVGTFVNGEFATSSLGVNFSTLVDEAAANRNYSTLEGALENGTVSAWSYVEYRIDWTRNFINFYVGGNLTRSVLQQNNPGLPSVPSPIYFKHWSTGNRFTMEGPPKRTSEANVRWIRMFFNSSLTTKEEYKDLHSRCSTSEACSVSDISLRGSTPYIQSATEVWKQKDQKKIKRMPALWISIICIAFSAFLLIHAFIRRAPWRKVNKSCSSEPNPSSSTASIRTNGKEDLTWIRDLPNQNPFENIIHVGNESGLATPVSIQSSSSDYEKNVHDNLAIGKVDPSPGTSVCGGSTTGEPSRPASPGFDSRGTTSLSHSRADTSKLPKLNIPSSLRKQLVLSKLSGGKPGETISPQQKQCPKDKIPMETVTESILPAPRMRAQPPPPHERIDYLAGLVATCAILVTVMHFCLTFVPGVVIVGAPSHYNSELWAQKFVSPFILNQMWLGVFFTTSVRFLVAGYLKRGDMKDIAKAAVRRTPRLMIPVASIALLQYFLVDVGATTYLRYIPSITWSTWPYVTRYRTFGHYVSEVLELIYVIPNAVPQITYNYCTGVLWTIAVQLQGTWLVLCGVIVIYEIRKPWKRMCYYMFCLVTHWYAQSWGSYLWLGLLLTDLDITYKYKNYLHERPCAYYPLIILCWTFVAAGFFPNLITSWVDFNFTIYEHNIHPDPKTGEPMMNTKNAGYPEYFVPRLNGLLFASGMQAIVELSPAVQWVLSLPPLLILFPHIFTIYLIHGLVFWSWGSWLMIFIADRGISYGVNVVAVGVSSYVLLFAILPVITPVIEALGKDITALCWMSATEKSPPRRRTLFPFPNDLFDRKSVNSVENAESGGNLKSKLGTSTPNKRDVEKGSVREPISSSAD